MLGMSYKLKYELTSSIWEMKHKSMEEWKT